MSANHESGRRRYAQRGADETVKDAAAVRRPVSASDETVDISLAEADALIERDAPKHSPGPWTIQMGSEYRIVDAGCHAVLVIADNRRLIPMTADARLIASAPDLLAALDGLAANVSGSLKLAGDDIRFAIGNTNVQVIEHFLALAKSALANAKGNA